MQSTDVKKYTIECYINSGYEQLNSVTTPRIQKLNVITLNQQSSDKSASEQPQEGERTMVAKGKTELNYVTLRTVPVILRNGNRKLKVNALLDDASTITYINSDVAAELGLQGRTQSMTINVLNGESETFETMPVQCELESCNGHTKTIIVAFTTDNVTGDMQPINWQRKSQWNT